MSDNKQVMEWANKNISNVKSYKIINGMLKGSACTYYNKSSSSEYIHKYGFDNPNELKEQLKAFWDDSPVMNEIIDVIVSLTFENIPSEEDADEKDNFERINKDVLPAYIYTS